MTVWNPALADMPFDHPVLVRPLRPADGQSDPLQGTFDGRAVPIMAVRHREDDTAVDILLGGNPSGYGWRLSFADLDGWLDVMSLA